MPALAENTAFVAQNPSAFPDRPNLCMIALAATRGDGPPIAFCLNEPPGHYSNCAATEFWQPDIYADFQFSAKDAKDWPEIHQEIIRVLNLLQKVQP